MRAQRVCPHLAVTVNEAIKANKLVTRQNRFSFVKLFELRGSRRGSEKNFNTS